MRDETAVDRERLIRRFCEFTGEYPWRWTAAHVDEWSACLTGERHLAPSTIRAYQGDVRLFTEFLTDARYGWGPACEEAFGTHPVAICHEWNTLAHLNDYEGSPEARPFTREELQCFLDYAETARTRHRPRPPLVPATRPEMPATRSGWNAPSAHGGIAVCAFRSVRRGSGPRGI